MLTQLSLHPSVIGPLDGKHSLGSRPRAALVRTQIEAALRLGNEVEIDFEGVEATQSFVDELIGMVVLQFGPKILTSVKFRKCSSEMKSIVRFVVSDRAKQYSDQHGLTA